MKKVYFYNSILMAVLLLLCGCAERDEDLLGIASKSGVRFLKTNLEVPFIGGDSYLMVEWNETPWELELVGDGFIEDFSPRQGGETTESGFSQIRIQAKPNIDLDEREQKMILTNLLTGEKTELIVTQRAEYKRVDVSVDYSKKRQLIRGFGGAYNPYIWVKQVTSHQMEQMFKRGGILGYNILRLMLYDDKNIWEKDVEGAKYVSDQGGEVFACPWHVPSEFTENITVNNEVRKHVDPSKYDAYADYFVEYINYMKSHGVNLTAVSVQNEPDMDVLWASAEIAVFMKQCGPKIRATGVELMGPEACGFAPEYTDPVVNDPEAMAQTDIVIGHTYQGFADLNNGYVKARHDYVQNIFETLLEPVGKSWWMTEKYFDDPKNADLKTIWNYQLDGLGEEIHACMEAGCGAYIYWYLRRDSGQCGLVCTVDDPDKNVSVDEIGIAKDGYLMAQYSKYATGRYRVASSSEDSEVKMSSYVNESADEVSVVILNKKNEKVMVEIDVPENAIITSASETNLDVNLRDITAGGTGISGRNKPYVLCGPRSVVSVNMKLTK